MSAGGYIVAGTDTDVGKTVFSAALAGALDAYYYKPVQAGTDPYTDRDTVARLSGLATTRILPELYRLVKPASPHIAAAAEGIGIDVDAVCGLPRLHPLVVECAGGLMVPLTSSDLYIDVIGRWQLPVILCARTSLGTINHTLLSLEALHARKIPVHGVAFIGAPEPEVEETITALSGIPRLGRLPHLETLNAKTLRAAFLDAFDLAALESGLECAQ